MKTMVTGRQKQLIKQVGEYLVAAELCRRELIATSFTGNVPVFDILAISSNEKMKTIQVKATTTNSGWNFDAADYLIFDSSENKSQFIKGTRKLPNSDMVFCFVKLGSFGKDNRNLERDVFYLVPVIELQKIIEGKYSAFLKKVDHIRPKKPESHHVKIKQNDISAFKENWDCILA
jgi:hypothetical protein